MEYALNNKVFVLFMAAACGVTFVACDVFTSMNRIKDMVLNEEQILNKIKAAAPQLLGNEQHAMYNFYKQRLEEIHRRNWTKELERLNHPNGAYSIIKEYAADYQALRKAVLDSKLNQASAVLAEIADDDDVKGASESLLRLQEVFRMKTNEMVQGMYLNYKGPILNSTDAFLVGKAAFEIGKQTLCTEWLQVALELMRQEQGDGDDYNDDFSMFGKVDTKTHNSGAAMKALLGRALIRVSPL
ncbi:unnamed protein product [Lymnaea stagnalis]|uniref:Prolyl 4-hydroxylase N-terminal domain-containing protein n=1 Tax=Lymnaea stagnalis TaxID=6523 RepID=A0AAV2IH93_LYMST